MSAGHVCVADEIVEQPVQIGKMINIFRCWICCEHKIFLKGLPFKMGKKKIIFLTLRNVYNLLK